MDFKSMEVIAVLLITVCGLSVGVYFVRAQLLELARRRRLNEKLVSLSGSPLTDFHKVDHFSDKLLALDQANQKVYFLDYYNSKVNTVSSLSDLQECELLIKRHAVQLDLIYQNPYADACSVVFFHQYINSDINRQRLTKKARKWASILSEAISRNRSYEYGITG